LNEPLFRCTALNLDSDRKEPRIGLGKSHHESSCRGMLQKYGAFIVVQIPVEPRLLAVRVHLSNAFGKRSVTREELRECMYSYIIGIVVICDSSGIN
jgi:hypothetical protein